MFRCARREVVHDLLERAPSTKAQRPQQLLRQPGVLPHYTALLCLRETRPGIPHRDAHDGFPLLCIRPTRNTFFRPKLVAVSILIRWEAMSVINPVGNVCPSVTNQPCSKNAWLSTFAVNATDPQPVHAWSSRTGGDMAMHSLPLAQVPVQPVQPRTMTQTNTTGVYLKGERLHATSDIDATDSINSQT